MKIRAAILKILALALATFLLSAQGFTQDSATLYKSKCAACHGADGKGATPVGAKIGVRDLASAGVQKQTDDELAAIINDGKNKMPSYKKSLKPEQVKDLVAMVRSFKK
jgi:mono/diheme cytochrome c family protein